MEFQMQISAVAVREGASDKSTTLGTWNAGFNNELMLVERQVMANMTADVVYRVVTVVVSSFNGKLCKIFVSFTFISTSLKKFFFWIEFYSIKIFVLTAEFFSSSEIFCEY